ncbi:hypothetical protein DZA51_00240 [Vibrio campbellii]|jgi:filamentous hemagglutinin|nr:hypothetical protein DZA51_00240 [Vibrio campbellii]
MLGAFTSSNFSVYGTIFSYDVSVFLTLIGQNAKQYVEATKSFMNSPPKGTLTRTRPNGDAIRYHEKSNTFGVMTKDGTPRTMFKPDPLQHGYRTNLEYFNAQ